MYHNTRAPISKLLGDSMESSGANWEMRNTWDSGQGGLARETSDLGRLVWDDLSLDPFEVCCIPSHTLASLTQPAAGLLS